MGFLFSSLHPAARVRVRVRRAPPLLTQLISHDPHHSSHAQFISHTQLVSHTTHNSSHTQLISHTPHLRQLISHTTHLAQLISHTTHLTHNSFHTTHPIHNSSHTTHFTQLISHTSHLTHNSSHTTPAPLTTPTTHLTEPRRGLSPQWPRLVFVWQAKCTELPDGAAARIVAAVAAVPLCVAGAVRRAS